MFHTAAYCACLKLFFPPIDIQQARHRHPTSTTYSSSPAHPVSVPIRHPSDKSSVVTSFETNIYIHCKYNKIPGTYAVYSCVWRLGCFPGAWRRGSWHFQVASLHLLTINRGPLSASHYFSFLSKRSGRCVPPAERSAL